MTPKSRRSSRPTPISSVTGETRPPRGSLLPSTCQARPGARDAGLWSEAVASPHPRRDQLSLHHGWWWPHPTGGGRRAPPGLRSSWVVAAAVGMDPLASLAAGALGWFPLSEGFCRGWGVSKGWSGGRWGAVPLRGKEEAGGCELSPGQAGLQAVEPGTSSAVPLLWLGRLLGSFLSLSPEYTFVLEDEGGLCGYAAGALCAEGFLQQRDSSWLPAVRHQYPRDLGAGAPALGQVRGHREQRGGVSGGRRGFLRLCLSPAGCPGGSTALLPHRATGGAPACAAALPLPGAARHGPPRAGRGGQPQPGYLPAERTQGQR